MEPFGILVSSAGRRGALVAIFRRALAQLGLEGPIVAADASGYSAAFHLADRGALVPPQSDPGFVDALLELFEREAIRLVIPTHDGELPLLAAARDRFAAIGATVSISDPATIEIGRDKFRTHAWLTAEGFPTVRQADSVAVDSATGRLALAGRAAGVVQLLAPGASTGAQRP